MFILIVGVLAFGITGLRWLFFNVIRGDSMLDGLVQFRVAVADDMEAGDESGIYYVKNVRKSDVHDINKYIDSAYGAVDTYRIIVESGEYLAIQFNFELSENYYVVRKYLYDEDIPADKEKAVQMYEVIDRFISDNITEGMSDFDKELAVHDYIVSSCVYGFPADENDAYTAYGALVLGSCVCDGYAEAFYLMMSCLGIGCDIVVGSTDEGLHAWNQVNLDGEWYNVDLTWDDSLPDMGSSVKHTYVNLTDDEFGSSHEWERQFYHECSSETYNFYKKKFYCYESFEEYENGIRVQIGNDVLEAAVRTWDEEIDLEFLYNYGISKVSYVTENVGEYKIIIVYTN